jgi:hypothetical protein
MKKKPHAKVATAAKAKQAGGVFCTRFGPSLGEWIYRGKKTLPFAPLADFA